MLKEEGGTCTDSEDTVMRYIRIFSDLLEPDPRYASIRRRVLAEIAFIKLTKAVRWRQNLALVLQRLQYDRRDEWKKLRQDFRLPCRLPARKEAVQIRSRRKQTPEQMLEKRIPTKTSDITKSPMRGSLNAGPQANAQQDLPTDDRGGPFCSQGILTAGWSRQAKLSVHCMFNDPAEFSIVNTVKPITVRDIPKDSGAGTELR